MSAEDGLALFAVTLDELVDGIRNAGQGKVDNLSPSILLVLQEAGLIQDGNLTPAGIELYRVAWVRRDLIETPHLLGTALRTLLPVQVIEQELRGFGAIPEDGVHDLLRLHRAVPANATIEQVRATFRWMNNCGLITYSRRAKTVRANAGDVEATVGGEGLAAMISPRTPFSNVARLRRVLRSLSGVVTWADPHFGSRAFEDLVFEIDTDRVTEVRIISGTAENVLSPKSWKDFGRFQEELAGKGLDSDWRVDSSRDWHDRWLVSNAGSYNMPPVNNLYQNQYSEILPSSTAPPVDEWWQRSTPRTQ